MLCLTDLSISSDDRLKTGQLKIDCFNTALEPVGQSAPRAGRGYGAPCDPEVLESSLIFWLFGVLTVPLSVDAVRINIYRFIVDNIKINFLIQVKKLTNLKVMFPDYYSLFI